MVSEPGRMLAWANGGVSGFPTGTVGELFAVQAARRPHELALVAGGERLTYADLNRAANRVAHRLRGLGVGREHAVGVCMRRDALLVTALLGVLKAGAAYVPLDPDHPPARLRFVAADAGVRLVLTRADLLPLLGGLDAPLLALDRDPELNAQLEDDPAPETTPRGLAYVIHTSGTTGRPKGVLIEHRGVVEHVTEMARAVGIGPGVRVLAMAAFTFDVSVFEIFTTLLAGASLHLADERERVSPDLLARRLRAEEITVAEPPAALLPLLDPDELPALRVAVVGGESPLPAQVARWTAGGRRLLNAYGPTEATVGVTLMECRGHWHLPPPIGRPMPNHRTYVLDADLQPVAQGVPGELCVAGTGLARGYAGRPDLTADRFVPDPFAPTPGERLYRTGDVARWLPDGNLEFLGRSDRQVKVRGHRIELGELEVLLGAQAGVEQAVAEVRRDQGGEARLVGWVSGAGAPEPGELRRRLAELVPSYMVPSAVVRLERMPLTAHGKIDRAALPIPSIEAAGREAAGPAERLVHDVWAEVLGLAAVGADRDFFELGGHSLHAARIVARVAERSGRALEVRDLFEARTVAGLAALLDGGVPDGEGPRAGSPPAPAPAQRALWFADRLNPGRPAYNVCTGFRLRGELDVPALAAVIDRLVARHRVLTARFPERDGEPALVLGAPVPPLALEEAAGRDAAEWLEAEAARPFDLERGPVFRARLLRLGPAEHVLALTAHHIVTDGWSTGVLLADMAAIYAGADLPEPACEYADFAAWQRARLDGAAGRALLDRWVARLAGAPHVLDLPADRPRPPRRALRGGRRAVTVPIGAAQAVRALAREAGASVPMAVLACLCALLSRLTGEPDLLVGIPVATRRHPAVERLAGYLLNTVPLRADLRGDPTFAELLARTRAALLDVLADGEVPFDRLVEELRVPWDPSRGPVVQVAFNAYNFEPPRLDLPGVSAELLPEPTPGSLFDLTVYLREPADGSLRLDAVYDADLFEAPRIEELLRQLTGLLAQAADDPERRVSRLSLVTEAARRVLPDPTVRLDAAWRGSVPRLLAAAAERAPGATAVEGGGHWRYDELVDRCGRLASLLREQGVGRGDVVAIEARREPALVLALAGVLWAGAAFTILDPAYPPARLEAQERLSRPRARLRLDALGEALGSMPWTPPADVGADDPAYVAFTSGSTGQPKGILGRHGPLTHFVPWLAARFGLGPEDRYSMLSGLAHDPLHRDVFTPLCTGAAVCCPPPGTIAAGTLPTWLDAARVTVAHLTPALGQVVSEPAEGVVAGCLPGLRLAFFVGDVLTRRDVARLRELAPAVTVVNYYGSTETQRAVGHHVVRDDPREARPETWPRDSAARCPRSGGGTPQRGPLQQRRERIDMRDRAAQEPTPEMGRMGVEDPAGFSAAPLVGRREVIPLGRGGQGVQLLVLTAAGDLAGVGERGEVHVRSPHLARGYVDDAALTAERFLASPFTGMPDDRMYRTGDLGRYLPDGDVEPLGRADRQVKVLGHRVELGEIEAGLGRHPAVREAVVTPPRTGDGRLVAYVVVSTPVEDAGLRRFLRERLPEHMVPAAFVRMPALPLTPNGKVDVRALPPPPRADGAGAAPASELERQVADVWCEVLGRPGVGVDDTFFDLGGSSLGLVRVQARLERRLGRRISVLDLVRHPTVRALAGFLAPDGANATPVDRGLRRARSRADALGRRAAVRARQPAPGGGTTG